MNVVKKKEKENTHVGRIRRFGSTDLQISQPRYVLTSILLLRRRCLENFKVEFHLFQRMELLFFFLIREWNDRDHVISSSSSSPFFRIRYLQPWTTLDGRGSFNSLGKTRSSFRKTKDFTRGDVKSVTVKNCLRFENAIVIVQRNPVIVVFFFIDDWITTPWVA